MPPSRRYKVGQSNTKIGTPFAILPDNSRAGGKPGRLLNDASVLYCASCAVTCLYPGSSTRTSTPMSRKAEGKAPLTSPKPPVLIRGAASEVANSTFNLAILLYKPTLDESVRRSAILPEPLLCIFHIQCNLPCQRFHIGVFFLVAQLVQKIQAHMPVVNLAREIE